MSFRLRVTDTPDDACRSGILGPLVAYNESKTGRSDHRPLVIAIDDSEGHVIGGLWGRNGGRLAVRGAVVRAGFAPRAWAGL